MVPSQQLVAAKQNEDQEKVPCLEAQQSSTQAGNTGKQDEVAEALVEKLEQLELEGKASAAAAAAASPSSVSPAAPREKKDQQHQEERQQQAEKEKEKQQQKQEPQHEEEPEVQAQPPRPSLDIKWIAELIRSGKARRIVCMCGAGISVSAGIPDFRTPGTGLYSQLAKYNLPVPEAVFSIDFFRRNPEPFHKLAQELFPGRYQPTATHYFMTLLHKKGLLLRCFTQNIDSLESIAGLPRDKVVPAHGNFDSAHCIECEAEHPVEWVKERIYSGRICICKHCEGLVKPDIVFFGEALPDRFHELRMVDFPRADLLIVLGTSLLVQPFAGLIYDVAPHVPRLLINREKVGESGRQPMMFRGMMRSGGFLFSDPDSNSRDALFLGDCDHGVQQLCELLGWSEELETLMAAGNGEAGGGGDDNGGSPTGKPCCSCL